MPVRILSHIEVSHKENLPPLAAQRGAQLAERAQKSKFEGNPRSILASRSVSRVGHVDVDENERAVVGHDDAAFTRKAAFAAAERTW